jgi:hypothetical protein
MAMGSVKDMQFVTLQTSQEKKGIAQDKADSAAERHEDAVEKSYSKMLEEAEQRHQAAEEQKKGALLGTIFGGFLIGTAIGDAIGQWANDDNEHAAEDAKKQWGFADMTVEREGDLYADANKDLEQANQDTERTKRFQEELRDADMDKTQI